MPDSDPRHSLPATAVRALGLPPEWANRSDGEGAGVLDTCYGRTVAGTPCELPPGHYPASKHLVTLGDGASWFAWTDESMREFARAAAES